VKATRGDSFKGEVIKRCFWRPGTEEDPWRTNNPQQATMWSRQCQQHPRQSLSSRGGVERAVPGCC
jgi:hypothetical protein